jgi:hypothetical protein
LHAVHLNPATNKNKQNARTHNGSDAPMVAVPSRRISFAPVVPVGGRISCASCFSRFKIEREYVLNANWAIWRLRGMSIGAIGLVK